MRKFFKWKSIPGWFLLMVWFSWEFLGAWARIEFVFKKAFGPEKPMIPVLTAIAQSRWFSIVILVVGLAWIWWTTRPKLVRKEPIEPGSLPFIEILSHTSGRKVKFQEPVYGTISIPNSPVQVLVHAGDDNWHPQRDAIVTGNNWRVECVDFGNRDSAPGSIYRIVAILPAQKIQDKIARLPSCPQSEEISVVRST